MSRYLTNPCTELVAPARGDTFSARSSGRCFRLPLGRPLNQHLPPSLLRHHWISTSHGTRPRNSRELGKQRSMGGLQKRDDRDWTWRASRQENFNSWWQFSKLSSEAHSDTVYALRIFTKRICRVRLCSIMGGSRFQAGQWDQEVGIRRRV